MRVLKILLISLTWCLILTTGCAPDYVSTENLLPVEPGLRETSFISYDGTELPLRLWQPRDGVDSAGYIFIAVHGFNDYSNFIKNGALYFNRQQIAVYSYDQRGFGNAPSRSRWSSTETMTRDLKTLIRLIVNKHPNLPVFLLGHSMGGALVIKAMADEIHPDAAGAILVAPAVWSRATMPFYQHAALWVMAHTVPWYRVTGESLGRDPSDNIAMLREQARDPLVIKETRFDVLYGLQDLMDQAYQAADTFSLKTLVLYGDRDEIIPKEPVLDVFRRFPQEKKKKLILYEKGFHMLLRDLQAEKVMEDIVAWVKETTSENFTAKK